MALVFPNAGSGTTPPIYPVGSLAPDDGFEELLLAAEIAVDRFLRDTGAARHRVDARTAVTVLQEILGCDVEHLLFLGLRLQAAFIDDPRGFPVRANQINLFPYATIRSGERCLERAKEGQRLLQRCLDKNPGTPWAFLAARELEHPVSVDFNWRYIPPPPPVPYRGGGGGGSPAPQIQIPRL